MILILGKKTSKSGEINGNTEIQFHTNNSRSILHYHSNTDLIVIPKKFVKFRAKQKEKKKKKEKKRKKDVSTKVSISV